MDSDKIYKIKRVNNLEDLKLIGEVEEVRQLIESTIKPLKFTANTYEELFTIILLLQSKWIDFIEGPFKDKQEEYIFYLTKLEGKQRNKNLGITDELYGNKELAKKWYTEIVKYVHPDKCKEQEQASIAFNVLTKLYKVMIEEE